MEPAAPTGTGRTKDTAMGGHGQVRPPALEGPGHTQDAQTALALATPCLGSTALSGLVLPRGPAGMDPPP